MKYKVTIEAIPTLTDSKEVVDQAPMILEANSLQLHLENGLAYKYINGKRMVDTNGQGRFTIKGWTGCASWDSFTTDGPGSISPI
jgi:hypothetical protein